MQSITPVLLWSMGLTSVLKPWLVKKSAGPVYAKTSFRPQDNLTYISRFLPVMAKPKISTRRRQVLPDIDLRQTRFRIDCRSSIEIWNLTIDKNKLFFGPITVCLSLAVSVYLPLKFASRSTNPIMANWSSCDAYLCSGGWFCKTQQLSIITTHMNIG